MPDWIYLPNADIYLNLEKMKASYVVKEAGEWVLFFEDENKAYCFDTFKTEGEAKEKLEEIITPRSLGKISSSSQHMKGETSLDYSQQMLPPPVAAPPIQRLPPRHHSTYTNNDPMPYMAKDVFGAPLAPNAGFGMKPYPSG